MERGETLLVWSLHKRRRPDLGGNRGILSTESMKPLIFIDQHKRAKYS
jgi:hypothetical protein